MCKLQQSSARAVQVSHIVASFPLPRCDKQAEGAHERPPQTNVRLDVSGGELTAGVSDLRAPSAPACPVWIQPPRLPAVCF